MNELSVETSPYLLQHANNPIHWKAWKPETLATAKRENKLIIISVGYAACHWCHVMEHESFEDKEVAEVMNKHFTAIKVDREERPDVDAIYMKAVQLMTGQGGWPMNVVLLPDGRPVWGGTYFRKENWIASLEQLQEMYATNPEKMVEYAEKLHEGISAMNIIPSPDKQVLPPTEDIQAIIEKWAKSFDNEYGGYARAPKFMMPGNYIFLQRYAYQAKDKALMDFVDLTLTRMAWGGLFDSVGGGFSRYSVDMKWHVPHFEKMLYDNGQLMSLYAQAYRRSENPLYKEVIEKTHEFIARELTDSTGAIYSATDADSLNKNEELEEGAFYVWEKEDLKSILGDDFELFALVFNINEFGFWENGNYVLIQNKPVEELAKEAAINPDTLKSKKKKWEKLLYEVRERREKPRLDDKVLTSWNALMLKGYADSYKALGDAKYRDAALKNADFIIAFMWQENGTLLRTYKNNEAKIAGFLDDYALTADAFIALHEITMDEKWLLYAKQLTDYCLDNFYDEKQQFFSFNAANGEQLIAPHFETEDNVIPASNSVLGNVLYTLSVLFNNNYYKETAQRMLQNIIPGLEYPSAFSNWLNLWLNFAAESKELAVCGTDAAEEVSKINREYLPHIIIAGSRQESTIPFLKNRFVKDSVMYYVCKNNTCNLPTFQKQEVLNNLKL